MSALAKEILRGILNSNLQVEQAKVKVLKRNLVKTLSNEEMLVAAMLIAIVAATAAIDDLRIQIIQLETK